MRNHLICDYWNLIVLNPQRNFQNSLPGHIFRSVERLDYQLAIFIATTYLNYLKEREEKLNLLRQEGKSFGKAYKETVCHLWEKYHRTYYFCYSLVSNAIHLDKLIEILRAANQEGCL